jgi:hypothetical protein
MMAMAMAVVLEEEGDRKGRKSNSNGNKVGNGNKEGDGEWQG